VTNHHILTISIFYWITFISYIYICFKLSDYTITCQHTLPRKVGFTVLQDHGLWVHCILSSLIMFFNIFLAYLSEGHLCICHRLAIRDRYLSSVYFSHLTLLLWNHWTKLSQTLMSSPLKPLNQIKPNSGGTFLWRPFFKIVYDSSTLHPTWRPLLIIEMSLFV